MTRAIGGHHSAASITTTWLTPPHIIPALGGWESFDLDPCAAPVPRPWPTARQMNAANDANGLLIEWQGRIWLNPPYTSSEIGRWLARLADHGTGTALVFARTETEAFARTVWGRLQVCCSSTAGCISTMPMDAGPLPMPARHPSSAPMAPMTWIGSRLPTFRGRSCRFASRASSPSPDWT